MLCVGPPYALCQLRVGHSCSSSHAADTKECVSHPTGSSEQSLTCDSTSLHAGGSVRRGMNPEPTAIVAQLLQQRISNTKEVHSILSWMDTLTGRVGIAIMNTNTQRLTLTHNQSLSPHYSTCHSHAEPRPQ